MEYTDSRPADLEAFGHNLEQLSELMTSLAQIENAKAEAAASGQHGLISGLLRQEQALILRLRGLEQHHTRQMKALGWRELNFRQILEQAAPEEIGFLAPLFERLTEQLRLLTDSRDSADRIMNLRLKEFEESLAGVPAPHFHDTHA